MRYLDEKTINNSLLNLNLAVRNYPNKSRKEYNCWGFVAYMMHWVERLGWICGDDMEELLSDYSYVIDEPVKGDIIVFRYPNGKLTHTAILEDLATEMIIHKPGNLILEVVNLTTCAYGKVFEYRRSIHCDLPCEIPKQKIMFVSTY